MQLLSPRQVAKDPLPDISLRASCVHVTSGKESEFAQFPHGDKAGIQEIKKQLVAYITPVRKDQRRERLFVCYLNKFHRLSAGVQWISSAGAEPEYPREYSVNCRPI